MQFEVEMLTCPDVRELSQSDVRKACQYEVKKSLYNVRELL